jgi:uracil-DNA glycosylase family 4
MDTERGYRAESLLAERIVACAKCPRLAQFLAQHRAENPDWWCRPVPGFGDPKARIVVLGLAPGLKGANRTGRPFTGDAAGVWLYRVLYENGLSNRPEAVSRDDGLQLHDVYIANAVKCVPPENKPSPAEVRNCKDLLVAEMAALADAEVLLCLGKVAHDALLAARRESDPALRPKDFPFAHGAVHRFPTRPHCIIDSYHPSRQNTNTGRLTWEMWASVFRTAVDRRGPDRLEQEGRS